MSLGVPTAVCTSGLPATQDAITTTTMKNSTAVASHHLQVRYATTGKDTVQNRTNVFVSGAGGPVPDPDATGGVRGGAAPPAPRRARTRDQAGQPSDQQRIRGRRPQHRQMG